MAPRRVRTADGIEIACEVEGDGPALVAVHGAGSAGWGFALLRPHLERRFAVWTVDRRGRGDSGDADGYALEREVEDVTAVVRAAGEGALLFGHSYGGLLAGAAAPRLPELPGLVLYEPPMGGVLGGSERVDRWEALVHAGERDRMVSEFLGEIGGYSDQEIEAFRDTPAWELRKQVAHTVPRELRAELRYELNRESLGGLGTRTLLLVGTESPAWAKLSTDAYADAIPGVTVRTLEGHGHGAALSGPELLAEEIAGFLL